MKVLGIDCAPSRASGSTIFDGEHFLKRENSRSEKGVLPRQLQETLQNAKADFPDLLICWDAPLTGPSDVEDVSDEHGAYTQRRIETVVRRTKRCGVSTRGYAGLPHWTLTRAILGLPRVGRYDCEQGLPFKLLACDSARKREGHNVVEVHPAIALWLWLEPYAAAEPDLVPSDCWKYKVKCEKHGTKKDERRERLASILLDRVMPDKMPAIELEKAVRDKISESDDRLDAFVAWLLGHQWLEQRSQVMMLGDRQAGSFLVPRTQLTEEWQAELELTAASLAP